MFDIAPGDLVSVVVRSANHVRFVRTALDSVYRQTCPNLELIVVDDCSTDGTADEVGRWMEDSGARERFLRSRLVRNESTVGAYASLNDGIAVAQGKVICLLNGSDWFHAQRIGSLTEAMARAGSGFAFSGVVPVDEEGKESYGSALARTIAAFPELAESYPAVSFGFLLHQLAASAGNFVFHRELYERIGGFRPLKYCHDWDFALRTILITEPVCVADGLYYHRLHTADTLGTYTCAATAQDSARASAEAQFLVRKYQLDCRGVSVPNRLAPTPLNWPIVFDNFVAAANLARAGNDEFSQARNSQQLPKVGGIGSGGSDLYTAILHIGGHKTGTTAIQTVFHHAAHGIRNDSGVDYPLGFMEKGSPYLGQHTIPWALLGDHPHVRRMGDWTVDALGLLRRLDRAAHLVLSSEDFICLDAEQIERLKECLQGFSVRIVLYVRRQDQSAQGTYQTEVIHYKLAGTFDDYMAGWVGPDSPRSSPGHMFDYHAVAKRWTSVFGKHSITVRVYEPDTLVGGDTVSDFACALDGILASGSRMQDVLKHEAAGHGRGNDTINHGLPVQVVNLVRHYNSKPDSERAAKAITDVASRVYPRTTGQYELIPPSARRKLVQTYARSNEMLAREFLGRDDGALFDERGLDQTDEEWNRKYAWEGSELYMLLNDVVGSLA